MASGSNYLTTYYAKRIIGDTAAETATKALLQTGTGIENDIWILHRTNRANLYGIKYMYDDTANGTADRIELYGGHQVSSIDTATAWVQLDTGDVYILGRVGINYDPSDNNNTYSLYVNGTTYVYGTTYLNDAVGIGYDPETGGNTYKLYVNGDIYGNNNFYLNGKMGIGYDPATSGNTYKLYVDGDTYFDDNTYLNGKVGIGYNPNTSGNAYKLYVNGTSYFNGNIRSNGHLYFEASKNIYFNYNNTDWPVLDNYNNSNTTFNACGGGLHIGYVNTPNTYIFYSNSGSAGTKFFEVNSNGAYALTRFGVNGQSTDYNLYVSGTANITNTLYLTRTTDAEGTANNKPALMIGNITGEHLEFDGNEIMAKASGTTTSTLYLNNNGGSISAGGAFTAAGTIHANGGYLKSTLSSNTVQIGSQNTSWCHITSSANIPFWFNKTITTEYGYDIGTTTYRPYHLYLGRSTTSNSNALNATNPFIEFANGDRSQYCQLIYSDYDSLVAPDSLSLVGNQNGIFFICKNGPIWVQGGSNAGGNVNRLTTTSGMPGNMQYNQSRRGTQIYSNGIAFCDPYNGNSNSDAGWIRHQETSGNSGELEIAVGDDGNESIVVRQYNTSNAVARTLTLLNSSGYSYFPSYINIGGHEKNASSPTYVWGSNSSDNFLRSYQTSKLSVSYAASAGVNMNGTTRTMQIRYGGVTLNYGQYTTVKFSPAFSNACLMVAPINQQGGYGAGQAISVDSYSKTSCRMYNYNTASAACWCGYIAIGY